MLDAWVDQNLGTWAPSSARSHADPRTTMRYDRARQSLDRHATYIVGAFVAAAADPTHWTDRTG